MRFFATLKNDTGRYSKQGEKTMKTFISGAGHIGLSNIFFTKVSNPRKYPKKYWPKWAFNLAGVAAAAGTAAAFVPLAYAERGYWAIGGEWMLVIIMFFVVRWICRRAKP